MIKNIQNHSWEVPEMALLVKDHKSWSPASDSPVPSRPVVSGNRGINTHLSELISEILEPMVLEMGGGEVTSTEEALHVIDGVNKKMKEGTDWGDMNIMNKLLRNKQNQATITKSA